MCLQVDYNVCGAQDMSEQQRFRSSDRVMKSLEYLLRQNRAVLTAAGSVRRILVLSFMRAAQFLPFLKAFSNNFRGLSVTKTRELTVCY